MSKTHEDAMNQIEKAVGESAQAVLDADHLNGKIKELAQVQTYLAVGYEAILNAQNLAKNLE